MLTKNTATLIFDSDLIVYYTSFFIEDGFLILYDNQKYLYTDKRYYLSAINLAKANCYIIEDNSLELFIKNNAISVIGIIDSLTSVEWYKKIISYGVNVVDVSNSVFLETSVKTLDEINLIKNSCSVLEKSLKSALNELKVGISEREFAGLIEYYFKLNGGDKPAFETIVAFGEGSSIPHYKTGDVKLKKNMPVLIDCGVMLNGYNSDITRSFYFGKAPKEYKRAFNAVLNAHNKALNEITSGISGITADAIARDYFIGLGYGEYFTHSLGHGIGVKIHEFPRLSPKSKAVLEENSVFSIEPGVYFDGKFGIRIEDSVYLERGKCKSFFTLVKDVVEFTPHAK